MRTILHDTVEQARARKGKGNKYHAKRTSCGEHEHASKAEAIRCGELQLLLKGKLIRDLKQQPSFDLVVNGVKIGTYRADWSYHEFDMAAWVYVVEDRKGMLTPVYRLKKRLMRALLGIEIRETR